MFYRNLLPILTLKIDCFRVRSLKNISFYQIVLKLHFMPAFPMSAICQQTKFFKSIVVVKNYIKQKNFIFLVFLVVGYDLNKEVRFSGETMGTTYHITVITSIFTNTDILKDKIARRLNELNLSMSIYKKNSEISRFNENQNTTENSKVSDDFYQVLLTAKKLYALTEGAWDGTVNPLVDLWGFGNKIKKNTRIPGKKEIKDILAKIGFNHINILEENYIAKTNPFVALDLGSIAKGYGVDEVGLLIRRSGIDNYLVEIGGEVYASGIRKDGKNWRIGVNTPKKDTPFDQVYKVVRLFNKALATSGDYRNFFEIDGKRYSHVIDPVTGFPVDNGIISVSIIADSCIIADGLATAVMVMGLKKGLDLIERLENTECLIIIEEEDGILKNYASTGFKIEKN